MIVKDNLIIRPVFELKVRPVADLQVRPLKSKKKGKGYQFTTDHPLRITSAVIHKDLKMLIAPEVLEDYKIFNKIFSNQIMNNFGNLSENDRKFIAHSYNILLHVKRYQTNKMKSILLKKEELSSIFPSFYFPIANMLASYKKFFEMYAETSITTRWLDKIPYVGDVTIFFLMAYGGPQVQRGRYKTAGGLWHYYGLSPTMTVKERVRQYKRLNPGVRDIFFRLRGNIKRGVVGIYSDIYKWKLDYELKKNEEGGNRQYLIECGQRHDSRYPMSENLKKFIKDGRMPDYFVRNRATKFAVKVLIAHFHHVLYQETFKRLPPRPYILDFLGGCSLKEQIPNWPFRI